MFTAQSEILPYRQKKQKPLFVSFMNKKPPIFQWKSWAVYSVYKKYVTLFFPHCLTWQTQIPGMFIGAV